jgi:ABC-type phosphate/phosphonate transport system substrate-binding protein
MYAVTPSAEEAWRELLVHISEEAAVPLDYLVYPAPMPLENLWTRPDLGAAMMCGFPIALGLAPVSAIAAPIPSATWAGGRSVYRTDFIVRADSSFRTLSDTFGHRLGWTVIHSHSGFNALRYHLLRYRNLNRPHLYSAIVGNLVTARAVVDAILNGDIDVGPLDSYWHSILSLHHPDVTAKLRIIESTDLSAAPAFIASVTMSSTAVDRLRAALVGSAQKQWFADIAEVIGLSGFEPRANADYNTTLEWEAECVARGYRFPA